MAHDSYEHERRQTEMLERLVELLEDMAAIQRSYMKPIRVRPNDIWLDMSSPTPGPLAYPHEGDQE